MVGLLRQLLRLFSLTSPDGVSGRFVGMLQRESTSTTCFSDISLQHAATLGLALPNTRLKPDGARRLWNESFFSAPQLKRISLGGNTFLSTRSAKGSRPNAPPFNEFSIDSMRWVLPS